MAIVSKYANPILESGGTDKSPFVSGSDLSAVVQPVSIDAGDDDGSLYVLFPGLVDFTIPQSITITNTAITNGVDYDLVIINPKTREVLATLMNGVSMASARIEGSGVSGLSNVAINDANKRLFELAGDTILTSLKRYDIALLANTIGTVAGTIVVKAIFQQG